MKDEEKEKDFFASESEPLAREGHSSPATDEAVEDEGDDDDDDDDDDRFNWNDEEEVIVHEQRALAVYGNKIGGIVIRQERGWDEEADTFIVLASPGAAYRLVEAIQNELNAQKQRRKG